MDIPLKSFKFLALDCQATSSSPKTGHLLEIGWLVFGADKPFKSEISVPETFIVRPPDGFVIPAHITKLTGLNEALLSQSVSGEYALEALIEQTNIVAGYNHGSLCQAVVHYARYEMAWVKHLYQIYGKSKKTCLRSCVPIKLHPDFYPTCPEKVYERWPDIWASAFPP